MKPLVIICHAYKTLPTENWYEWLAEILRGRGYEARVLTMPNPHAPTEAEWVSCIKEAHTRSPVIFVGHSLGCRAILAYINQYSAGAERVVLVACPVFWEGVIETRPPLRTYVEGMRALDLPKIKNLVGRFDLFHDTTDHLLPMKNVEYLKEIFGERATVYILSNYGHFDVPEVPEIATLFE